MGIPRVYIDSAPLINAIEHKFGNPVVGDIDAYKQLLKEVAYTKLLLEAALNGDIEIVASLIVVAEVRRSDKQVSPKEHVKKYLREILLSGAVITPAEVTQSIVEKARDLDWEHGCFFHGADSIHLATAIHLDCTEFITSDKKITKNAEKLTKAGFPIRLITPSCTKSLPSRYLQKYQQMSLLDEIELVKGRKRKRDEVRVSNTKQIEKFKSSSVVDGISILPVTSQASSGSSEIGDHPTVSSLDSATESIKL